MERSFKNSNYIKNIKGILENVSDMNFCNINVCCQNGQIQMNILPFILFGQFWKNILKSIEV